MFMKQNQITKQINNTMTLTEKSKLIEYLITFVNRSDFKKVKVTNNENNTITLYHHNE